MKAKSSLWRMVVFFIFVTLPILACGLFTDEDGAVEFSEGPGRDVDLGEATVVSEAPTVDVEDGGTGADAPPLPALGGLNEALAAFNSYRILMEMRFEDGADPARSGTISLNTTRVLQPPASAVEMSVSGAFGEDMADLGEGATLSFVELGETTYSVIPGIGCISGAGGGEIADEFDDVLDADAFLEEIEGAEYVGEETVHGVATHHYRFDETGLGDDEAQLREAKGDVYVSQEHGYVVRMVLDGVGEVDVFDEGSGEGNLHLTMDVLDVGQPIVIEPPAGCEATGAEYPVMGGARDLATFAGLTTYTVDASLEEVVTFYQDEMVARGYQGEADPFISDTTALLTFNAEGMPTVSVTVGVEGEAVTVLITAEEN